jgi:hypothetical protein
MCWRCLSSIVSVVLSQRPGISTDIRGFTSLLNRVYVQSLPNAVLRIMHSDCPLLPRYGNVHVPQPRCFLLCIRGFIKYLPRNITGFRDSKFALIIIIIIIIYLFIAIGFAPGGCSPTLVQTKTIKQHYTVVQHRYSSTTHTIVQHNTVNGV